MLKKRNRLTKKEFDTVFSKGKRYHSPELQLIYQLSDTFHGSAVVGKKVYKKAVDRNKLRRRMYSILYQIKKEGKKTGTFILIAKPTLTNVPKKNFSDCIENVLKQVR